MTATLLETIESVICDKNEQTIANIGKEMEEKQMELIHYANSDRDYESHADSISDYDEELVRLLVEKVTIFENNVVVRFKSGIEVEV